MRVNQPIQSAQIDGLSAQFQRRWESTYHWRSMCSMLLGSPALRAAWPMSAVDYQQPECTDISGHGYDLQAAAALGNVTFGQDPNGIAPIANFGGGANQYLTRADGGVANWADITGGEAYILAANQGLTLSGWFWWAALPGANPRQLCKDDGAANRQYAMLLLGANTARFAVFPGPVTVTSVATINTGWNHIVGRYDQTSQDINIILNGVIATNAGAAPAALPDTAAPFTIGADGAGGNLFTGYASDCLLCAASLSLGFILAGYHYTKAAYGVK